MKGMVKWFENAPLWLKVIFALPGLDIIWAIFRIVKGAAYGKTGLVLVGILWLLLGWAILWIIDIVSILIKKHPILA
ncbi:MAG: hypothetical protein E7351_00280 [Clostridiales bacterium]|nr:hypothetical protein [Clostridiales bacterium]